MDRSGRGPQQRAGGLRAGPGRRVRTRWRELEERGTPLGAAFANASGRAWDDVAFG